MGCIFQHVVGAVAAIGNFLYFLCNVLHGLDKPVQLLQRFAFRGLYHQGAMHREGQRGGMKPVIHQPFGNIGFGDVGGGLEAPAVEDHLMAHQIIAAGIQHLKLFSQAGGQVIGIQNGDLWWHRSFPPVPAGCNRHAKW